MLSPESVELLKKNQVLFSTDEFIPSGNEPFDPVEFVQSYRRRVRSVGVLKDELTKLSKLIDFLIGQEINENYESFIKYSVFLSDVKKQINERMENLGDNTDEIPILKEFYEKVVGNIHHCELYLHKSELFSHLKKYASNTRHLYVVLRYNLKQWYQEFKDSKNIIIFDQISLSLREFHVFYHGELENSRKNLENILLLNKTKFKQDQGEPEMIEVRKTLKRVKAICKTCYDSYSKYYNSFKNDLRQYFLLYSFNKTNDSEGSLQLVVRSIGQLHLFRWIEEILLQEVIPKKIEINPPRRVVGAKYIYNFNEVKEQIIEVFKSPLFDAIHEEGLMNKFKLFDNVFLKYFSDFIFFNPRFKFLYSLIDEKNFHSHYHNAVGFLRDLCVIFHGDWDLTISIRKKWSVRLYFISNKKKMMESFEQEVEKNFEVNNSNEDFHFNIFNVFVGMIKQLFSPSIYIDAKGKEFFTFFLSLLSRFGQVVCSDEQQQHVLFDRINMDSNEGDFVALLHFRLDSLKLESCFRKSLLGIIHSATRKNLEMLTNVIDEWIENTIYKKLIPRIDQNISEYIIRNTLVQFNMMKTHYMSIATSEALPTTISDFVVRMFGPIDLAFSKSKDLGIVFSPEFKETMIRRILEIYMESYNRELEGYQKRMRSLMKLRKHQRTRSQGGSGEEDDGEEMVGVNRIFEQIRIDNEDIKRRIGEYFDEGQSFEFVLKLD